MISTSCIDVGASHPFVSFEHVNINTGGLWDESFETFYFKALGFVNDPRAQSNRSKGLKWVNLGHQQIHMPASTPPQKVRGHIGLEYGNLDDVLLRLQTENIAYTITKDSSANIRYIETVCPIGNVFRLHKQTVPASLSSVSNSEGSWLGPLPHVTPSIEYALPGGLAKGLGISYVDFLIPHGSAARIGAFYGHIFGSSANISINPETNTPVCVINVGYRQSLRYTEVAEVSSVSTDAEDLTTSTSSAITPAVPTVVPAYDGHHIAVYVNDFVGIYHRLKEAGLVFENPRFGFRYGSLEDVLACNEFRLLDLVDLETREVLYQLEHEIRSLDHPAFSCPWLLSKNQKVTEAVAEEV